MRMIKIKHITALVITAFPVLVSAQTLLTDFRINNNTNSYITSTLGSSRCSAEVNEQGKIKPKTSANVPSILFELFCKNRCEVKLYMSKNCEATQKAATLLIDRKQGLLSITNHHSKYQVTGSGFAINVNGGFAKRNA